MKQLFRIKNLEEGKTVVYDIEADETGEIVLINYTLCDGQPLDIRSARYKTLQELKSALSPERYPTHRIIVDFIEGKEKT
jgi:hypothetical protein